MRAFARTWVCLPGIALLAASAGARAQVLEEVVVTAERRETSLQDTPLSIAAFTSESLELKGVDDLQDVSSFTPNFEIKGARGQGDNTPIFSIRGLSSGGAATSERSVALYVDGIPMPRSQGSLLSVVDVERIEILRGPQGTLFGRNSTGGAVRVFTRQPAPDWDAYLKVTGGNFERRDIDAMINVPVNERFFLRGQAAYLHEDGFVRKGSQKLGGNEEVFARLQGKFLASDTLDATLSVSYSDTQATGSALDNVGFDIAPGLINGNYADWLSDALVAIGQPPLGQQDPRILLDDFTNPAYCLIDDFDPDYDAACDQSDESKSWATTAQVRWKPSDRWSVSSLTGFTDLDHQNVGDWQGWGMEIRTDALTSRVFFQEFQLNTQFFGERVDFVTGVNYYSEDATEDTATITRRSTSTFSPTAGPLPGNPPNADAGLFRTNDIALEEESRSYGLFASGTWHLPKAFNLTTGVRFAYDRKDIEITEFRSANFTPVPGTDSTTIVTDDHWDDIDWRVSLDKSLNEALMVYGTVSKAYRAGTFTGIDVVSATPPGFIQTGAAQSAQARAIPPEQVLSKELGARTEWFDRKLRFNVTRFWMDYTDRQAARQILDSNSPVGFRIAVVSSGDVDISGWELEGQWAPTAQLAFDAAAGFIDYTVLDPVANSGPFLFPEPAERSFAVGSRYTVGRVTFGLNYAWQSAQQTHPTIDSDSAYEQPSYGILNGRVRFISDDRRWDVSLFANNLTDRTYATFSNRFGGGFFDAGGPTAETNPFSAPRRSGLGAIRGRPREWGVSLRYNFF